ncbi:MAG: riboflavin biosynthesis protein RibD [Anaerocolumna sp.]|jgi:diaminohydroxyphosphoribosylaminopyrimidine deaminase/5-amino-6-(5-phosphoribosylamino)uracil reductase|nr:riboflavin biosynthesis protein RibD [Anaerocolumna sp.]
MDIEFMKRALELAQKGEGFTNPNPLVGAVIVKDGTIIGEGYHQKYGSHHAEINAFNNAKEDVCGATMYVTLEPCAHFGKTPPCANTIVQKGIKKVVIALKDPNPLVSGKGIEILKNHGIEVVCGVLEDESKKLNEIFIKYITTKLPFCILKTAMTLDGKIATYTGDSQWITNKDSRQYVHQIRNRVSSIMVGIGTILSDNPKLNTRLEEKIGNDPIRIIVDTYGKIPLDANVLTQKSSAETIIVTTELAPKEKLRLLKERDAKILITPLKDEKVDLNYLVNWLGNQKIDSILLEGGSELNYSALKAGIVDKVNVFIAPKIIGGNKAKSPIGGNGIEFLKDAININSMEIHKFGSDFMIEGYVERR